MFLSNYKNKIIREAKKKEEEKQIVKYRTIFKSFINEVNDCLYESSTSSENLHPVFTYIKQITDFITLESAQRSHLHDRFEFQYIASRIIGSGDYSTPNIIYTSKVHDDDLKYFENILLTENQLTIMLAAYPIILNTWCSSKITNAMMNIAVEDNEFSISKANDNVQNHYYYPMGIIECAGGNHSQFSAKMKGKGTSSIQYFYDMENIYEYLRFDGINYIKIEENGEENIINFDVSFEEQFYFGLLFESGRLMKAHPNIFPKEVREFVSLARKIKKE